VSGKGVNDKEMKQSQPPGPPKREEKKGGESSRKIRQATNPIRSTQFNKTAQKSSI